MRRSCPNRAQLRGLLVWLVALVALLGAGSAPADARQGADYVVTAEIDGDRVSVSISELSTAIGSLQLELRGAPDLASDECALVSGMGACAQTDDIVRIVALNPTGWQEPTLLVELEFVADASGVELVVERGTDVQGLDLIGQAATTVAGEGSAGSNSSAGADGSEGSGATTWIVLGLVGAAVVGLLAGLAARRRTPRQDPHTA